MPALIQNVSEVIEMADELGDMVHREIYSEIRASRTDQERMRILYGSFRSGGVRVKAAFYDILKKHQPSLVEKLGKSSGKKSHGVIFYIFGFIEFHYVSPSGGRL